MSDEQSFGPFPVDAAPVQEYSEGVRFGSRYQILSDTRAGKGLRIGVLIEELQPGKQSAPAHYHMHEEEHVLMLEGEAMLRLGDELLPMKAGDFASFPAGRKVAHALLNMSDKLCRYIVIGENNDNDVCVYPDSGKVKSRWLDQILRPDPSADYWTGENADTSLKGG